LHKPRQLTHGGLNTFVRTKLSELKP